MRIKSILQITLLGFILSVITACIHTPTFVNADKTMACIAPNIYVDPKMSSSQRQQFLSTVKHSQQEIAHFFGGMQSSPSIYACTTKACFEQFGGVAARAKSIDDKRVLLSSRGLDKTTLTHELAHVELHNRLGSPALWNKLPMWFDEGLAVMVCKDHRYAKAISSSSAHMALNTLVSQDQWVAAVRNKKPAYNVARHAVSDWYNEVGAHGLQAMIESMHRGEAFSLQSSPSTTLKVTRL